jgi:hypothetical protein
LASIVALAHSNRVGRSSSPRPCRS